MSERYDVFNPREDDEEEEKDSSSEDDDNEDDEEAGDDDIDEGKENDFENSIQSQVNEHSTKDD